jgi:pimeloyl-ACP methyl ester carboxylesterase
MKQEIQFCTTSDGVSIAYSTVGVGQPFVKAANWMNHLELDWRSPVWRHVLDEFSRDQQLVRYDERGTGLSDRKVSEISLDAFVRDLESVVDSLRLERFPLLGISQGGPVAIAYAIKHPERVSHLILLGTFAAGWRKTELPPEIVEKREAQLTLIRQGWNSRNPAIRQLWTTLCIPDSLPEEAESFTHLQRESVSSETAARIFDAIGDLDVFEFLPTLHLPVLVLHCRGDATVPFEEGRKLASMIPGAKFVPLDSNNHLIMSHEPAWSVFINETREFLGRERSQDDDQPSSARKFCPTCRHVYRDVTLNFCLDDGSVLSLASDSPQDTPEATKILPNPVDKESA